MAVLTTLDIPGLTAAEYRRILDHIGVETKPAPGIYLHLAQPIAGGFRITELWDTKAGIEAFLQDTLYPAAQALGIQREVIVSIAPLHNVFVPRVNEIAGLAADAPGRRSA